MSCFILPMKVKPMHCLSSKTLTVGQLEQEQKMVT